MASRKAGPTKRGLPQTSLKWDKNSERGREGARGVKPLPEAMTLPQMAVVLVMYSCRKVLLMKTVEWRIAVYSIGIMFGSILCDFFPLPKAYMADKTNFLNVYFAKLSWGWTVLLVGAFVYLTSSVYCCGIKPRVAKHVSRMLVGTLCWYFCIKFFVYVESATGFCIDPKELKELKKLKDLGREACLNKGYRWRGFDISGHTFLLMYSSLVIYEEAKAINGWERIKDLIRDADYDEESPLRLLAAEELEFLKTSYERFGNYVKGVFVAMTLLDLLWVYILIGTVLYYHSMAQKLAGGLVAIVMWFLTYRVWYNHELSPGLPGQGPFKYAEARVVVVENRRRSIVGLARPPLRQYRNGQPAENEPERMQGTSSVEK